MRPPGIKGQREKEFRKLRKQLDKLWLAQRNLGYEKLDKPIHRGWDIHLVLRDDIKRRRDAPVLQEIVDKCGLTIWNRKRKLLLMGWEKRMALLQEYSRPGIRKIGRKAWMELSPPARKWFEPYHAGYQWNGKQLTRYRCKMPHYFCRVKIRKSWYHYRKRLSWELEKEISEVDARLEAPEFCGIKNRNTSRYSRNWYNWTKDRNINIRLDRKKTRQELSLKLLDPDLLREVHLWNSETGLAQNF